MATLPVEILEQIVSYGGIDVFVAMNQCLKPEYRFKPKAVDNRILVSLELQLIVRIERMITTMIHQVKDDWLFSLGERIHTSIDLFEYVLEHIDLLWAVYRDLKHKERIVKATYAVVNRLIESNELLNHSRTQLHDRFEAAGDRLKCKCLQLLKDS